MSSGQLGVELRTLEGMTPEERAALIGGASSPERLREFERSRNGREEMLRRQIDSANQLANSNFSVQGHSTPSAIASIVANALRTFGGIAQGFRKEKELAGEQTESARQHEDLMRRLEGSAGAGLSTKQRGLADAVRGWDGSI